MLRRLLCPLALAGTWAAAADAQTPLTHAERSGFQSYTPYDSMMTFLQAVQGASTEMRLGIYGRTHEGRELPYAIFSRPSVTEPWEAWTLDRPIVVLNANVHGDERTLRESLLLLIRELADPGSEANRLLDDLVIIIAPQINPDGFEASTRASRGNAWGIDLNRDWVKREQPALASYATNVIHRWAPHLFVDGHNGGSFPYHLNYQCPSHGEVDPRITSLCDEEIFPAVDARLADVGYRSFFYQRGTETAWFGGGSDARIGRNYGGFANMIGMLFESPEWQSIRDGVTSGIFGYTAVLEFVRDHPQRVMDTVERARRETIHMGRDGGRDVVVQMEYGPEPYAVTYEVETGEGPNRSTVTVKSDSLMKRPVATLTRPRPYAYLLPRDAVEAVAMLRRNGVTVEVLQDSTELDVRAYVLTGVTYEPAYNHQAAARVRVGEAVTITRSFPRGTYVVPTGQMMGRVAAHMLEPETNDNVVYWNTMDGWLPKADLADQGRLPDDPRPLLPVFKVMHATPLPTRLMR